MAIGSVVLAGVGAQVAGSAINNKFFLTSDNLNLSLKELMKQIFALKYSYSYP